MTFAAPTYTEAYAAAQELADRTGLSVGLHKPGYDGQWSWGFIPRKSMRFGVDASCQAVEPTQGT